jgi:hypothetical protein
MSYYLEIHSSGLLNKTDFVTNCPLNFTLELIEEFLRPSIILII